MKTKRTRHAMRKFVSWIRDAMRCGMPMSEAARHMTERGVPIRVQYRVIDQPF